MKRVGLGLAALITLGVTGTANAQNQFQNPEQCVSEIGALDANGDGYVDGTEFTRYGDIQTNVDTDGDRRISNDGLTVACNSEMAKVFVPKE